MAADNSLAWGDSGSSVTQLQQTLNNNDYWCGSADGIFGSKTYNAVVRFQKDAGITVDGIAGPITLKYLGLVETAGSTQVSRSGSRRTITMTATGYCPCAKCNYPFYDQPSYLGYPLRHGIIATDPRVIPMGTRLYIPGYGEGIAADQGGAIKGNRLDLCFANHQQALNWGLKTVTITILD
ncbi:cell wall-binding protein [hydrocarbon metagenome]|uniref:Cell wall-binding protein n=1 Tax=hydrocarbon metagenome TaxID=938273 RepID=A0A0W8E7B1_9ZZZZ